KTSTVRANPAAAARRPNHGPLLCAGAFGAIRPVSSRAAIDRGQRLTKLLEPLELANTIGSHPAQTGTFRSTSSPGLSGARLTTRHSGRDLGQYASQDSTRR